MCRRTIAVVVALLFVALPTFGGGQQGDDNSLEVVEVEFWNLFGGGDGETIASIVDEYNELNPGVEIVNMTQDWGQYYTKLRTAVLGGTSPDLGVSHITRLLELKSAGLIEPLGSVAEEVGIPLDFSVYPDGMADAVTFDGDRYALPMDNLLFVLLANKAILREYGLVSGDGRAQIPDGAREFKNMLAEIGENGEYVPLVSSMGGWSPATLWFTFYQQMNGGRFLSDDNRSVAWDRGIALDAMTELNDLYAQFVPPELDDAWELFKSGEVALYVTGPWDINQGIAVLG